MFFVNDYGVGKTLKKTVEMREKFELKSFISQRRHTTQFKQAKIPHLTFLSLT